MPNPPLTYAAAGVDIDTGNRLIERIAPLAAATRRPGVLSGLGGFGGLFELPAGYRRPVLVSGTDGVGTKLKLALDLGQHDTVGIDLVAMCVNDVIVTGAEPLFFLDYYATGRLEVEVAATVIAGIAEGCRQAGCALIGGETAEMPGMYRDGDYDLAGFCVGIVEHDAIITAARVRPGDALIAVASSGPHSNGYSLIRKVLERSGAAPSQALGDGGTLGGQLIAPTRIYVRPMLGLIADLDVHGVAHITGGGITENLPRVLPDGVTARVDLATWDLPPIFRWLAEQGRIAPDELLRTFNCGIGMCVCVPADQTDAAIAHLSAAGERAWIVGRIDASLADTPASVTYAGTLYGGTDLG